MAKKDVQYFAFNGNGQLVGVYSVNDGHTLVSVFADNKQIDFLEEKEVMILPNTQYSISHTYITRDEVEVGREPGNLDHEAKRMVKLAKQIDDLLNENECQFIFDNISEKINIYNRRDDRLYTFPKVTEVGDES